MVELVIDINTFNQCNCSIACSQLVIIKNTSAVSLYMKIKQSENIDVVNVVLS